MKLLIVIVNYKSAGLTIDCLKSLLPELASVFPSPSPGTPGEGWSEGDFGRQTAIDIANHPRPNPRPGYRERGPEVRVIVTDNASPDDSVAQLNQAVATNHWADTVTIQPLPRNGGFAYGNNAAIRDALGPDTTAKRAAHEGYSRSKRNSDGATPALAAGVPSVRSSLEIGTAPPLAPADKPDFILLLNPDTIVRPGAIDALLKFMADHPTAGLAGSRLEDPDGTVQVSAFRFHSVAGEIERGVRLGLVTKLLANRTVTPPPPSLERPTECDWVAGASLIVRRQVFEEIGLMDEDYFMYFEETDFCLTARRAGWSCWYVPASRVVHLVGAVSQMSDARKHRKRRPAYWFESRRRYFLKNHGRLYAMTADAAYLVSHTLWRLRRFIQRKPDPDPPKLWIDTLRHSTLLH